MHGHSETFGPNCADAGHSASNRSGREPTDVVSNDASNSGVTWSLRPTTGSGSLNPTTTTEATYDAQSSFSSPTAVTVTAISVSFPTQTASLQITVERPAAITTASLLPGRVKAAYSGMVDARGGVPPFTGSPASGALPPGLSIGSSTSDGIANCTLGSGTVTFTEPANLTGHFFAISPTKLVVVATPQGDPYPVTVVVGNSFVETVLRRSAGRAELSSAPSRTTVGANDAPTCILDRAVLSVRV
jgi:hypothetical protein